MLDTNLFGLKLRAAFANNEKTPVFEWIDGVLQVSNDEGVTFTPLVGVGGSPDPWLAKYSSQAQQLTGITDESLQLLLDENFRKPVLPYGTANITASTFQSRSGGTMSVQPGGVLRIDGGNAAQGGIVRLANIGSLMLSQQAKRFFAIWQWRIATNQPNANSRFYFQIGTTTACHVAAGFCGPTSTATYGFSVNTIVSSAPKLDVPSTVVPVVGRLETGLIYYDGRFIWGSINGEPWVLIADASKMLSIAVADFYFDSFPTASGQTDAIELGGAGRAACWGET